MFAILSRLEIAVTVGVLGAIGLVLIARSLAPRRELLVYGVGLGITAVATLCSACNAELQRAILVWS